MICVERQAEPLRQAVTRVQIRNGRGLVVDLPVLEQDSSLQVHWVVPSTERRRGVASGRGLKHTPRKMATAYRLWQRSWRLRTLASADAVATARGLAAATCKSLEAYG